ncbi:hypothetical protein F2Q65_08915 [Thiohalocapsa marina]|uniref:SPOR domain-containing protein n=1 Tax=Thiohalocapsa marina TaxID=424902 RepID=A0A5M8FL03_9GAMM|nr:SPOR domain-containing protein [Thiohalocapsa marina]KAA6185387.1 hypothetical protein F2Q65_08915 [Thiohalocapsa marina]
MTLDYRKGSPARPRKRTQRRGTCAFWFLLGGLLGGFAVGVAWMRADQSGAATVAETAADARPAAPTPKPKFDFYSLLPEEEVVVPAEREPEPVALPPLPGQSPAQPSAPTPAKPTPAVPDTAKATPAPTPASPPGNGPTYLLQVGSFRKTGDAERLKAQLAMLGVQTSIQTVTIASGQTYHRVRTGRFTRADADALKSRLKRNGHDALMMRVD